MELTLLKFIVNHEELLFMWALIISIYYIETNWKL